MKIYIIFEEYGYNRIMHSAFRTRSAALERVDELNEYHPQRSWIIDSIMVED